MLRVSQNEMKQIAKYLRLKMLKTETNMDVLRLKTIVINLKTIVFNIKNDHNN